MIGAMTVRRLAPDSERTSREFRERLFAALGLALFLEMLSPEQ